MQHKELIRLYEAFESMFPTAHIRVIDSSSTVSMESHNCAWVLGPESYSSFKEIQTFPGSQGDILHRLSFPIPPQNQLVLYLPFGDVEDILTAAKMADSVIQLFLSKPTQTAQSVRQSDTMLLLDHLFHPSSGDEGTYTALLAAELGFDMSLPRAVCIFRVQQDNKGPIPKLQSSHSILQTIRNFTASSGSQDIIGSLGNSELILCHVMEHDNSQDIRLLENIYTYINRNYPVTCAVGVGLTVTDISHYRDSFLSAQSAFRYAQNRPVPEKCIYCVTDYLAEHLVYEIPEHFFEHFLKKELAYLTGTPTAPETVRALVENNMDLLSAAESLFIHRNTLVFRLNQLKKQLDLNPLHRDNDRFKLILLHHYYTKKNTVNHLSGEVL